MKVHEPNMRRDEVGNDVKFTMTRESLDESTKA